MQSQKFLGDMNIGPGPWVAPRSARIYIPYLHSTQYESAMFDPAGVPGYWCSTARQLKKNCGGYSFLSKTGQGLLSRHPCQKERIRRDKFMELFSPTWRAHAENQVRKQIPKPFS